MKRPQETAAKPSRYGGIFACIQRIRVRYFIGRLGSHRKATSILVGAAPLITIFSTVTYGLLWFVFRYNLLYVSVTLHDTENRLYLTALKQFFNRVYILELYLIDLFLSIYDDWNIPINIG